MTAPRRSASLALPQLPAQRLVPALLRWFDTHRRDLPWRPPQPHAPRDPYHVLVSELMLQQTQVSRVVELFPRFLARFPTIAHLAQASEQDVLAAWTGLGYYRRARLLHAAARAVVEQHQGSIPADVASLRELPGIGAYTAGAVASLGFAQAQALVDTNVARVLRRLGAVGVVGAVGGKSEDEKAALAWAWEQAQRLVTDAAKGHHPGVWNEALMELGALVCTASSPACERCPLATQCAARARGVQGEIPPPKARASRAPITHACAALRDAQGRIVLEQRPASPTGAGLWAGLWQLPCAELAGHASPARAWKALAQALAAAGVDAPSTPPPVVMGFSFLTSHRDVRFLVFDLALARAPARWLSAQAPPRRAIALERLPATDLGLSSPMRRILRTLAQHAAESASAPPAPAKTKRPTQRPTQPRPRRSRSSRPVRTG